MDFSYGSVEIYVDDVLGIGSYGKVCKAKCGQLPCAAKLLHDTLFQDNDPGTNTLARRFEQECQFLSNIKHPNIIQYLGTVRDPKSQRPVLLMELMDESLTKFLEQSSLDLPYHSQLNICHDVALALAYLHSNTIIHRDLSSNNVLLIGEGIRAKVTDFGMSKLTDINPHMTPLTQCPGTLAYMPPEALITPPHYSSKLDIFSHGVLTIQIITRNFPKPGHAVAYVKDPKYPTGRIMIPYPEAGRRKKDIDVIETDHPLLPTLLRCIKDIDIERPSADDLCEGFTSLKYAARYKDSVEQTREQTSSAQRLQLELKAKKQLQRKAEERQRELEQIITNQSQHLQEMQAEKEMLTFQLRESQEREHQCRKALETARSEARFRGKIEPQEQQKAEAMVERSSVRSSSTHMARSNKAKQKLLGEEPSATPLTLTWRRAEPAPVFMSSQGGAAVAHGNTAYFSQGSSVYSYKLLEDKWTQLQQYGYYDFSLAVVNDKLTTIGGSTSDKTAINALLSLTGVWKQENNWRELLPPMPTPRVLPATITTTTHLVVAGGRKYGIYGQYIAEIRVEVMDTDTHKWSIATSLPQGIEYPNMISCGGFLYITNGNTVISCSVARLLQSCQSPSDKSTSIESSSKGGSVWTRLADIPVDSGPTLATLGGLVLAIGGVEAELRTGVIHCYDRAANSWSVTEEMPTPQDNTLVTVLHGNEVIVVGGGIYYDDSSKVCEIGSYIT